MQKIIDKLFQLQRITSFAIAIFFRQFATLLSAGIPLLQCCDTLEKSQTVPALRLLIHNIKRDILSGKSLSQCLSRYPAHFNELIFHLVRIGEHTGRLDFMLSNIALHLEKKAMFKQRVKQALFYPCMVLLTGIVITISMFVFVIPRFAELFQTSGVPLPTLTICIFYVANHMSQYVIILLFITLAICAIYYKTKLSITFKRRVQHQMQVWPVIKTIRQKILLVRFTKQLAITFAAGIPILDGLKLTANACDDSLFSLTIAQVRQQISSGMQLHHALSSFPIFPILMIQMIKIGEQTGMLAPMLDKMTDFYEADINELFSRLGHLAEPLIMIILGVLIGGLVIGMYLPIFKLGNTL
jgi:type IV pilus assembly protein PilC